jgi:hypothetical protein
MDAMLKKTIRCRRRSRGSAMAEFIYIMPIMGIIFMAMFQLYLLCDAKHRVIQGARYVAWEQAFRPGQDAAIKSELNSVLSDADHPADEISGKIVVEVMEKTASYERSSDRSGPIAAILDIATLGGYYFDPVFSLALFLGGDTIPVGLVTPLDVKTDTKIKTRIRYDFDLDYLPIVNELGKMLGGEDMNISPIKLKDSSVLLYDDWASASKHDFAKRVGVPDEPFEFSILGGLWLYPAGGIIGDIFSAINSVFEIISSISEILSTLGDVAGVDTEFPGGSNPPFDLRGRYFRTDNAPDHP